MTESSLPQNAADIQHSAALAKLLARINYERADVIPYHARGLKLDRMHELLMRLGNPEQALKIIHIAGTKGKGSTAAMVASVLTASGRQSGLFTSPHLEHVEQRFAIDGQPCSRQEFVALVDRIWPIVEAMDEEAEHDKSRAAGPTYFEITTAMALMHFAARGVDAAVLEVGLGGRLDSTNVCRPLVSVITSISFDHTRQLGNTLAAIAGEKAGIIKPGVPVVSGVVPSEPREVIRRVARSRGCRLVELARDFWFDYRPPPVLDRESSCGMLDFDYRVPGREHQHQDLALGLLGRHQAANAAIALATIAELRKAGWDIPDRAVRSGLLHTRLPARIEIASRRPTVIIDAAHNVASIEALLAVLEESFSRCPRTLIFGSTVDKDIEGMLSAIVPHFDRIILTQYRDNPRAVPLERLDAVIGGLTSSVPHVFDDPAAAWEFVRQTTETDHLICATGSFYLAAEMRRLIAERPVGDPSSVTLETI